MSSKVAVIDMGTNTFHLLLVELIGASFKTLYKEKIPVKIGEGGISRQMILPEAQKRAFHTLGHFTNLIAGEGVDHIFAFATSAVRNATNGLAFVQQIQHKFGLQVHVIDGNREAELIYKGIRLSGSLNGETSLMMDIGGGSVEFIIGNESRIFWKKSFEIGGQRMLDMFHYHDPILPSEVDRLNDYLSERLQPLLVAIHLYQPSRLVGASGTFDTLTDIYLARINGSRAKNRSAYTMAVGDFHKIAQQLLLLDKAERLKIKGMIPMRVDMIVVASCLIVHILQHLQSDDLYCSSFALKEGAIAELLHSTGGINEERVANQVL